MFPCAASASRGLQSGFRRHPFSSHSLPFLALEIESLVVFCSTLLDAAKMRLDLGGGNVGEVKSTLDVQAPSTVADWPNTQIDLCPGKNLGI